MSSKGFIDPDLSEIIIYLHTSLETNSAIEFLAAEETDDALVFEKEDKKLFALFSIDHIVSELYDTLQLNSFNSNKEKSKRLIEYAINDA